MRKLNKILMVVVMLAVTIPALGAMSTGNVRKNTRFLTDRMAYELNLSQDQYDDVYEVNYDFINNVRYIMSNVSRGDYYAIDRYYDFLDVRNDDLRWILSPSQYSRFIDIDYFYRPIYTENRRWTFRIYDIYSNINFFYFGRPYHYSSYNGGHYRTHYNNISFYQNRWSKRYNFSDRYHDRYAIRDDRRFDTYRKHDFGVNVRPNNGYDRNNNRRPEVNPRNDNNNRQGRDYRQDNNNRYDNNNSYRNNNDRRYDNNNSRYDNNNSYRSNNDSRPARVDTRRDESTRPARVETRRDESTSPVRVETRRDESTRPAEARRPSSTRDNSRNESVRTSSTSSVRESKSSSSSNSNSENSSRERNEGARRR